ncbi:hypothetical protein PBY51_021131 [Eleginops maclovinus]|uniref:Leucine rich adaptor protein 1 n=1 Tax=Eleginops maclovinus TaxID=56733 RepID=A0AAN7XEV6_ELEMC|nr:hypothetical protein PBY51_021131 [Eleginops maclovinus]
MAEETFNDSLPDLKEVENKVGRKTPESLLIWMRDAADGENGWRSDVVDMGDRSSASFSDKISNLKQEMRCLRSADVRILRQLVAVHEGIEAMRWLMEDRGSLTSHGSSLTGSLSSLVTEEEASMFPCRESLSPTQDFTETSGEESADHTPSTDDADTNHKSCFDMEIPESTEARHSSPSTSEFESQPQNLKAGADIIRRALHRSSRARRDMRADSGSFSITEQSQTDQQTQEHPRTSQNTMEEKKTAPNRETALLGYDAQWCWVESLDDVMFL